ncbi:hypothetical protein UG55_11275 [Frankia sp. EI5c]|uniref:DUF6907 domain-containing protein n=1 Tax=Frankia sp. EI5c TaxID=683316 RepID=UPI0007C28493|nr:hypothetical protein [Frankia sp. EI5c]OAA18129.1 hypothetical protein UG55_11275 [Frankia sp. EI5c]
MPDSGNRHCPSWCEQPAGHLNVQPAGPGDYHLAEGTVIELPEIPGLRDITVMQVAIEQYVTAATTYQPVISLGHGVDHPDNHVLTLDEAAAVAEALTRAVAAVRTSQAPPLPPSDNIS